MENKTDDVDNGYGVAANGCPVEHNVDQLRINVLESFVRKMFSKNFDEHVLNHGSTWNCCNEKVPPEKWPLLAELTNVNSVGAVTPCPIRPPVIVHLRNVGDVTTVVTEDTPTRYEASSESSVHETGTGLSEPVTSSESSATIMCPSDSVRDVKLDQIKKVCTGPLGLPIDSAKRQTSSRSISMESVSSQQGSPDAAPVVDLSNDDEPSEDIPTTISNDTEMSKLPQQFISHTLGTGNRGDASSLRPLPLKPSYTSNNGNCGVSAQRTCMVDSGKLCYRRVQITHNNGNSHLPVSCAGANISNSREKPCDIHSEDLAISDDNDVVNDSDLDQQSDGDIDLNSSSFLKTLLPVMTLSCDEVCQNSQDENDVIVLSSDEENDNEPSRDTSISPHSVVSTEPASSETSNDGVESRADNPAEKSQSGSSLTTDCASSLDERGRSACERTITLSGDMEQELVTRENCIIVPIKESTPPPLLPCSSSTRVTPFAVNFTTPTSTAMPVQQMCSFKSLLPVDSRASPTLPLIASIQKFKSYRDLPASPCKSVDSVIIKKKPYIPEYDDGTSSSLSDDDLQEEDLPATVILECSANAAASAVTTSSTSKETAMCVQSNGQVETEQIIPSSPSANQENCDLQPGGRSLSELIVPKRLCIQKTVYCHCQASFESNDQLEQHKVIHHPDSGEDEGGKNNARTENPYQRTNEKRKRKRSTKYRDFDLGRKGERGKQLNASDSEDEEQNRNANSNRNNHRVRPPKLSKSRPRQLVQCPYCKEGVSRSYRWEHLRKNCTSVTEEDLKREEQSKGKVTWLVYVSSVHASQSIKVEEQQLKLQPGRAPNAKIQQQGALTDTEGQGYRKGGSRGGAQTDWNSSDEEPIINKKERSRSLNNLKALSSSNNQQDKKLRKIRTVQPDGTSSSKTVETEDAECENGHFVSKKMKVTDPTPGSSRTISSNRGIDQFGTELHSDGEQSNKQSNSMSYREDANMSIDTELVSADEDVTCILDIPSAPSSQASTTTTSSPPLGEHKFKTDRVQCKKCGKLVSKNHLLYHTQSNRCKPNGEHDTGDDSQLEAGEDAIIMPSLRGMIPRSKTKGTCAYCKRTFLKASLRNHVYKACPIAKAALERGETLDYTSQEEDSQAEEEEERSKSVRVKCSLCHMEMNANSLYKHQKLKRCKVLKDNAPGSKTNRNVEVTVDLEPRIASLMNRQRAVNVNYLEEEEKFMDDFNYIGVNDKNTGRESETQEEIRLQCQSTDEPRVNVLEITCKFSDCGHVSESQSQFKEHMEFHQNMGKDGGYPCEHRDCNKVFWEEENMQIHYRTHTPIFPFDATGVSYKKNQNLQPTITLQKYSANV